MLNLLLEQRGLILNDDNKNIVYNSFVSDVGQLDSINNAWDSETHKLIMKEFQTNKKSSVSKKRILRHIKVLNLSYCELENIGDLNEFFALEKLIISNNYLRKLNKLPSKLKSIQATSNCLSVINHIPSTCIFLGLSYNQLDSVDFLKTFDCSNLIVLDVSYNNLYNLNEVVEYINNCTNKLEYLNLEGNPICLLKNYRNVNFNSNLRILDGVEIDTENFINNINHKFKLCIQVTKASDIMNVDSKDTIFMTIKLANNYQVKSNCVSINKHGEYVFDFEELIEELPSIEWIRLFSTCGIDFCIWKGETLLNVFNLDTREILKPHTNGKWNFNGSIVSNQQNVNSENSLDHLNEYRCLVDIPSNENILNALMNDSDNNKNKTNKKRSSKKRNNSSPQLYINVSLNP